MLELTPTFTNAGIAALINVQNNGLQAEITAVALGDTGWLPDASATGLQTEQNRIAINSSSRIATDQIHLVAIESGTSEYWVKEVGFYLADGTLLAVWSSTTASLGYKAAAVDLILSFDLKLTGVPAEAVTVTVNGTGTFDLPAATTERRGIIELSDDTEASAGTNATKAINPYQLQSNIAEKINAIPDCTKANRGLIRMANNGEAAAGSGIDSEGKYIAINPYQLQSNITAKINAIPNATTSINGLIQRATDAEAFEGIFEHIAINPKQLATAREYAIAEALNLIYINQRFQIFSEDLDKATWLAKGFLMLDGSSYDITTEFGGGQDLALNHLIISLGFDIALSYTSFNSITTKDFTGYFARAAGSSRAFGSFEGDAIRNITGQFHASVELAQVANGAFTVQDYGSRNSNLASPGKLYSFDASRVVPTAAENRPKNANIGKWFFYIGKP